MSCVLDDVDRMKPCFLMELELADDAEPVEHVDEAGVLADSDHAAHSGKLADSSHPDFVVFPPEDFIGGCPVPVVGAVIGGIGFEILLDSRMEVILEPGLVHGPDEVAVGLIDDESRTPGHSFIDQSLEDFFELLRVCLPPEMTGIAEPVTFVAKIIPVREILRPV